MCFTSLERDVLSYDVIHREFRDDVHAAPVLRLEFTSALETEKIGCCRMPVTTNKTKHCHKTRDWTEGT